LLKKEHGAKQGPGKQRIFLQQMVESATHSGSKAASTTNAPQDTFQLLHEEHSCQKSRRNQINKEKEAEFD
jgi:hypothetical protein